MKQGGADLPVDRTTRERETMATQKRPQQGQQKGGQRPGAMTMAMQAVATKPQGPKVLRIGLIQDGKIIEERIIRRRETVSVGTSEKNHFIVQAKGLPARFDLFQLVGSDYILNFTADMKGRVGLPGGVQQLEQACGPSDAACLIPPAEFGTYTPAVSEPLSGGLDTCDA